MSQQLDLDHEVLTWEDLYAIALALKERFPSD